MGRWGVPSCLPSSVINGPGTESPRGDWVSGREAGEILVAAERKERDCAGTLGSLGFGSDHQHLCAVIKD